MKNAGKIFLLRLQIKKMWENERFNYHFAKKLPKHYHFEKSLKKERKLQKIKELKN